MNIEKLAQLICPSCRRTLVVSLNPIRPTFTPDDPAELVDGFLQCGACRSEYPIIQGTAILVRNPMNYIAANYLLLSNLIAKAPLSSDMQTYLDESCYDLVQPWDKARFYDSPDALNMYICSHYDRLSAIVGKDTDRFAQFVGSNDQDLFNAVTEMVDDNIHGERGVALDVGANVAGMTWRLAQRYGHVYGIDIAFAAISTARRVLLHMPTRMERYRLYQEGQRFEYRDLAIERQRNIELLAASGLALPFADDYFDLINCSNVIDVVSDPEGLITELDRTLKIGGLMVVTDPYRWEVGDTEIENWIEGGEGGASAEALVAALSRRGYEVLEERDMVPWLLRRYRRHYSVWLNHCVIARKQKTERDITPGTVRPRP